VAFLSAKGGIKMAKRDWNLYWNKIEKHQKVFFIGSKLMWRNYKRLLKDVELPKNPKILELGCGSGILSLWLVKHYGGEVTLVDYSKKSLEFTKELYKNNNINVETMNVNILHLKLRREFDLVHSQGLIEHFKGTTQDIVIKKHQEFLKKNGIVLITAPRPSFVYKIRRRAVELFMEWPFGYEKPINTVDGIKLLKKNGLKPLHLRKYSVGTGYISKKSKSP
jgi:2-polyprenyl-3-methyl-5-hydroxy-6-metoxy-1,4-benzoquinol methylase